jgi:hypothetical protein
MERVLGNHFVYRVTICCKLNKGIKGVRFDWSKRSSESCTIPLPTAFVDMFLQHLGEAVCHWYTLAKLNDSRARRIINGMVMALFIRREQ